ncbi:MAG TPA: Crp/Fnr family transcriptional regulator [Actinomycetota bacterium]
MLSAMHRTPIRPHDRLIEPGRAMRDVYFPLSGVISLMTPLVEGAPIETATVGFEGMVGVHAFLGGGGLGNALAIGQVPGEMLVMNVDHFRAEAGGDGKLRGVMLAYTQALFAQISQAVACNGVHEIQQRTAKWLLETHDRAGGLDDFELTQEFLADMLGVTRPSVTVAARTLQSAGLIEYRRGHIKILDRQSLEDSACECYATVRREYVRLMGAT